MLNTEYDPFAWVYERDWGSEYHEQGFEILNKALLKRLAPGSRILDVCCGNGRLTSVLVEHGYRVTGLDSSEEMLKYAKERAPGAELVLADARDFHVGKEFDAAISTFDSLNHVPDAEGLARVFRNVFEAVRAGGWFVFDLNEEPAYTSQWVWPVTKVTADRVFIARGQYDGLRRVAWCDVTAFRSVEGQGWVRTDFRLTQTLHAEADIRRLLAEAGFIDVERLDARLDLGMLGGIGFARSYYRAAKPERKGRKRIRRIRI